MNFLTSVAIIVLCALLLGMIFKKIKLPSLIGLLLVGILLGPYVLNLISGDLLAISADLRKFALIVILTRAGVSLNLKDLKKVGRPALLMCFLPACFEIVGYIVLAPLFLDLSIAESALTGAVMAAVSPAVVVPRMLKLQTEKYGTQKGIPQMITAGASCDDVFVIVLFTALLGTVQTGDFNFNVIWQVPVSILLGVAVGALFGLAFSFLFKRLHIRDTVKLLLILCFSCLFCALETAIEKYVPFSGLLAIISMGIALNIKDTERSRRLSTIYEKLWVFAEILLFVLVGAEVDVSYLADIGGYAVLTVVCALAFRMLGVFACLIKTNLDFKERLFCAVAYIPKATVQAAIGAIPLSMALPCGKTILTCAVIAILVTAPIGAFATDLSYKKLLSCDDVPYVRL